MRKALIALAGATVLLGLFSPAEAATRTYSIVLNPAPAGKTDPTKSYNDTALDVSEDTDDGRQKTRIKGYVKRGKVASTGTVKIYATNTSTNAKTRKLLGSGTLSKSGYFTRTFDPGHDNAGIYKIEIVKGGGSGYATTTKTLYIRVFQFVDMSYFFDKSASNPLDPPLPDGEDPLVSLNPGPSTDWSVGPVVGKELNRFATSYSIRGSGTAVFDLRGQTCLQFNLKIGLWNVDPAPEAGAFSIRIGSRTLVPATVRSPGQNIAGRYHFDVAKDTEYVEKDLGQDAKGRVTSVFSVSAADTSVDPQDETSTRNTRLILGRPMVSCTYPVINP